MFHLAPCYPLSTCRNLGTAEWNFEEIWYWPNLLKVYGTETCISHRCVERNDSHVRNELFPWVLQTFK
jgi:hypothetical protein